MTQIKIMSGFKIAGFKPMCLLQNSCSVVNVQNDLIIQKRVINIDKQPIFKRVG